MRLCKWCAAQALFTLAGFVVGLIVDHPLTGAALGWFGTNAVWVLSGRPSK